MSNAKSGINSTVDCALVMQKRTNHDWTARVTKCKINRLLKKKKKIINTSYKRTLRHNEENRK